MLIESDVLFRIAICKFTREINQSTESKCPITVHSNWFGLSVFFQPYLEYQTNWWARAQAVTRTGATSGAGTTYPSGEPDLTSVFVWFLLLSFFLFLFFYFCVILWRSLFVSMSFIFLAIAVSVLNFSISGFLVTPLVSK